MKTCKRYLSQNIGHVEIVGVGGTGSYLAEGLAKMISGYRMALAVCLTDPDVIEEKNIYRQNFLYHEIGMNKAEALALRLNQKYGLSFAAKPQAFEKSTQGWNTLFIGCVDNIPTRREHLAGARHYLDCGNGRDFGQVVYGNNPSQDDLYKELDQWDKRATVSTLPSPATVLDFDHWTPPPEIASCADHPFGEQGCFINEWVASAALGILHQLLVPGSLSTPMIAVNFAQGRMVPSPITQEYFRKHIANYEKEKSHGN